MANITATLPAYSSGVLDQVYKASAVASLVPIHRLYLPLPPLTLIHALVVSHNSLLITGYYTHNKGKVNLATSVFFNQLLLFGPLSVLSAMLAQPCPVLLAPEFIYIYAGIHIISILSGLGYTLVSLSQVSGAGLVIDAIAALVDAFARMDGIAVLGVEVVRSHPNSIVSQSPFAALLIGTGVGVGSILMLGLISFESLEWTVRKPTWLVRPSSLLAADFISSFLATLSYFVLTSSNGLAALIDPNQVAPVYDSLRPYVLPVLPYAAAVTSSTLNALQVVSEKSSIASTSIASQGPILSSAEARALGALIVLVFSLGARWKRAILSTVSSTGPSVQVASSSHRKANGVNGSLATDDAAVIKASARKSTAAKKRK